MHHKSPVLVYLIRIAQRFFALILSPHTILFDGEQRSKEKKKKKNLAFLSRVQKQQDHYWKEALQSGQTIHMV